MKQEPVKMTAGRVYLLLVLLTLLMIAMSKGFIHHLI